MSGLLGFFGGAAEGAGKVLTEQRADREQERREARLRAFRIEQANIAHQRALERDEASHERTLERDIATAERNDAQQVRRDARLHKFNLERDSLKEPEYKADSSGDVWALKAGKATRVMEDAPRPHELGPDEYFDEQDRRQIEGGLLSSPRQLNVGTTGKLKDSDLRAQYKMERDLLMPSNDMAQAAIIGVYVEQYGEKEGRRKWMEDVANFPDYDTWSAQKRAGIAPRRGVPKKDEPNPAPSTKGKTADDYRAFLKRKYPDRSDEEIETRVREKFIIRTR